MADMEFGKCDICGNEAPLRRTVYRYNIKCDCHSPSHFETVSHCAVCTPVEPEWTTVTLGGRKVKLKTSRLTKA